MEAEGDTEEYNTRPKSNFTTATKGKKNRNETKRKCRRASENATGSEGMCCRFERKKNSNDTRANERKERKIMTFEMSNATVEMGALPNL
jgi:hypothetical protein